MLLDLTPGLFAAVAAAVVPGYFWSRLFATTADRAERLAFSTALSITLVPATALALIGFSGTGVTLAIAIVSVLAVFVSGLAAYRIFSSPKGLDEPIIPVTTPPGPLALALLALAFGLVAAAYSGILQGRQVMLAVALLLLFAGLVYTVEVRRGDPVASASRELEPRWPAMRRLLLPMVLLLVLFRGYSGPVLHDWPYLRGGDQYFHAMMANMMLTRGKIEPYAVYPPGLHTLDAVISRLSGLEPVALFPVYTPALILLPPLALYALARRMWGWEYGVAAAALSGLVCNSTFIYLSYQAMYPTLVSAEFLLVMAVAALVGLYARPSARSVLLLALLGSSVALYHPVGSLYAAALFGLVGVLILPYLLLRERRTGLALLGSFALLGLLAAAYAWDTYNLPQTVADLLRGSGTTAGGQAVSMAVGTQAPLALEHFLKTITQPVLWLGLLGALLMLGGREGPLTSAMSRSTLLLWCLVLFVGSRTSVSGFPERFERDLAIPLSLLAAFALVAILRSLRGSGMLARAAAVAVAALVAGVIGVQAVWNLHAAAKPSPRVVLTPQIVAAGEWLGAHNTGGNIMVAPRGNQVTGRAMLALSGYFALEAFTEGRIHYDRDLPPYGAGPLLDVLYVIKHPDDERTRQLLEKHDVRYVVFYKRFGEGTTWDRTPVQDWRGHVAQKDLYRVAFENEGVIVLEPRPAELRDQ
ncbi:MAG TPA: hypothetical protein VFJ72_00710 [Rubrobacteraceae bacterium]|nr:hypothetical protein [Rubrobacteraceae bacterium]